MDQKVKSNHLCDFCGKGFSSRQGKCNHKKICGKKPQAITSTVINNTTIINNNTTIINNTFVDEGQYITIVHNIHINAFGTENKTFLTDSFCIDIIRSKNKSIYDSICDMISHLHFNPNFPQNANIYIQNKFGRYGYQWRHLPVPKWDQVEIGLLAEYVLQNSIDILSDFIEENPDKFSANDLWRFRGLNQNVYSMLEFEVSQKCIATIFDHKHILKNLGRIPPQCIQV